MATARSNPRSRRIVIPLLLASLAAAAVAAYAIVGGDDGDELRGSSREPRQQVADVRLSDVTESDDGPPSGLVPPPGELTLVYFGFASCPDVCPTTLADVGSAIRRLSADDRRRVTVAFITVDPKRDSGKLLRGYLGHFFEDNPSRALRTDDPKALAAAEKAFGASHTIGKPKKDGGYDVSHTAFTYAVDSRGEVVVEWPFGMLSDDIAHDLEILLDA